MRLSRARDIPGLKKIIVPAIDCDTSRTAINLSKRFPDQVYAAVGIHPNYSNSADCEILESLIQDYPEQIVAIGEIGLDFYRTYSPEKVQLLIFESMLKLATKHRLPILAP